MSQRPTCIDCGANAPDTNTNYTLISTSFGWRLTRRALPGGGQAVEWRCATCWRKHKTGAGGKRAVGQGRNGFSEDAGTEPRTSSRPPHRSR
jgi:hypothetical protein